MSKKGKLSKRISPKVIYLLMVNKMTGSGVLTSVHLSLVPVLVMIKNLKT